MNVEARRPALSKYAGRYVALDLATDVVLADAATMLDLVMIIRERRLRASIVRAPRVDTFQEAMPHRESR
jgi:hypothetical protein